jgi:hypothetical protein
MKLGAQESLKSELRLKSYEGFKIKDLKVMNFNSVGTYL